MSKLNNSMPFGVRVTKDEKWEFSSGVAKRDFRNKCSTDKRHWTIFFSDKNDADKYAVRFGENRIIIKTRPLTFSELNGLPDWLDNNIGEMHTDWFFTGDGAENVYYKFRRNDTSGTVMEIIIKNVSNSVKSLFRLTWE